jgi:hypothetical protein
MKTIRSRLLRSSGAVATAAILAFWFTFGSQVVRADDPEIVVPPGQEMVLMPEKSVSALEQRVMDLEKTVAALTDRWQHLDTHRLCVSDDSGAETCITKAQLDSFLRKEDHAEISQPAPLEEAKASPPAAPIESAATTESLPLSEPTSIVGENSPAPEPETTGTINTASSGAAIVSEPEIEIYEEPAGRTEN